MLIEYNSNIYSNVLLITTVPSIRDHNVTYPPHDPAASTSPITQTQHNISHTNINLSYTYYHKVLMLDCKQDETFVGDQI
jgi:hypothetical protein